MKNILVWVKAARLRTLPLAFAASGSGNLLASYSPHFQWTIAILSILTTLLLQILSNFANDLGDSIQGADHAGRKGPKRAVQSGELTKTAMQKAVLILAFLSLISGSILLWICFGNDLKKITPLFALGLFSIAAAYFYTNGKKPYGYQALGDISVFTFFGFVAVFGTQYLHTGDIGMSGFPLAMAMACWSTAVLNINNMRDIDSDQMAGKETIPTKLGLEKAKVYHYVIVSIGILSMLYFGIQQSDRAFLLAIPGVVLIIKSTRGVSLSQTSFQMDANLRTQALGTFICVAGVVVFKIIKALLFL